MSEHLCLQCRHYAGTEKPNGTCVKLKSSVWSRRPQCVAHPQDLFEPVDTLGNQLRTARVAAGLSRNDVCVELEVTSRALQKWELDERVPIKAIQNLLFALYDSHKNADLNREDDFEEWKQR